MRLLAALLLVPAVMVLALCWLADKAGVPDRKEWSW